MGGFLYLGKLSQIKPFNLFDGSPYIQIFKRGRSNHTSMRANLPTGAHQDLTCRSNFYSLNVLDIFWYLTCSKPLSPYRRKYLDWLVSIFKEWTSLGFFFWLLICRSTLPNIWTSPVLMWKHLGNTFLTFFILWKCLGNIVYLLSIGPLHVNLLKSWIIFWDVTIYLQQEPRKPLMMISDIVCVSWVCKKREATDYWAGLCHNFWFWGENYIFKTKI